MLLNGNMLTPTSTQHATAVAVKGDLIAAVGTDDEVADLVGPLTVVLDLEGMTVSPGFTDAHQHRIGNGPAALGTAASEIVEAAVAQGLTTIDELYVDEARLAELVQLDGDGDLPLFVNAYFAANENSPAGTVFDPYWNAYQPGDLVSPHVRIAGLKVFTDFDNAQILLWDQGGLTSFLRERHDEGWPLAVKTVSTTSLQMVIDAMDTIAADDPSIIDARVRLEHNLFATDDQIRDMARLGMVPAINLNVPGQLVGEPDIDALIAREPAGSYAPWRSMVDAGLRVAGISGFPSFYVDEPTGAPFGSPLHLIYQAVTGVGNLGRESPPELLDEAITARDAFDSLTINAAYAAFEDEVTGSIEEGKRADLVVLYEDPLSVDARAINGIQVYLTIMGGEPFCVVTISGLCPKPPPAGEPTPTPPSSPDEPRVSASLTLEGFVPANAFDGDPDTIWNAGAHPEQWLQLDLGQPSDISGVTLLVAQDPPGQTTHEIWVGPAEDDLRLVETLTAETRDFDELSYTPAQPLQGDRIVRIVTTSSPSWVAWREVVVETN